MSDATPSTPRVHLTIVPPRGSPTREWLAREPLRARLPRLDWAGPITVTGTTEHGVSLRVFADGRGGWEVSWWPGIDGRPQFTRRLDRGTEDVYRAFATLASPGSPLASTLPWEDAPEDAAPPEDPADEPPLLDQAPTAPAPITWQSPRVLFSLLALWTAFLLGVLLVFYE